MLVVLLLLHLVLLHVELIIHGVLFHTLVLLVAVIVLLLLRLLGHLRRARLSKLAESNAVVIVWIIKDVHLVGTEVCE